jgi:hypothetical protein
MIPVRARAFIFLRSVWQGALGILAELGLVALIILSGLAVSLFWWGLFR